MALLPAVPSTYARNYLAKMALSQMTSTIQISRPTGVTFNPATGLSSPTGSTHLWTGPGRFYAESGSLGAIGGEMVSVGTSYVAIPQTATPVARADDIVLILTTLDDPALVNSYFRVVDVSSGGIASPTRKLTLTTIERSPWSNS